ncbi:MAG: type IV pilus biogenesis protein PilM [Myxococcota bacterium]
MARILGLDISETAVRGVLVVSTLRQSQLTRYVEEPIEPSEGAAGRAEAVRAAVGELLVALGSPPDSVVASLDGREASLRVVELPAGAAKRVAEVLPFELEAMLPFPIEDAVVDHQPVDRDATTLRVLAAAVPKPRVAARLDVLRSHGVEPKELAVGAAALDGLVPLLPDLQEQPGPHLLVQVDEGSTDVCIVHHGHCELARTLSGGMREIRTGRRAALETQLRHTLASHRASGGGDPVRAFLAGEAATFPQAVEWLAGVVDVSAQVLPLPPVPGADDAHRPRFARAAALAGRALGRGKRLNLRRDEFAPQRTMGMLRRHGRLIATCAAVVLVSFIFSVYARWTVLADEHEELAAQLEQVTGELFDTPTADPTSARDTLESEQGPPDPLPRFDAYHALEAVSDLLPEELTHKHDTRRLEIDYEDEAREGRLQLQGTVASVAERDSIAAALEGHECFHEIDKGRTTPGPGNQGLNYQLEAEIRCPGAQPLAGAGDKEGSRGGS